MFLTQCEWAEAASHRAFLFGGMMLLSMPMKKPFKIVLLACIGVTILSLASRAKPFDKFQEALSTHLLSRVVDTCGADDSASADHPRLAPRSADTIA